jgi:hypothetical protein
MAPTFAFWQLGSVGMLGWGVAAALPILIHLWSRRKYRQEAWAAMAFLLAAMRKNSRRIELEQWILVAVRTAILLLFAIALADPRLSLLSAFAGSAGQTHTVLVLDGSYSMDYRPAERSRFEMAKELARQLVANGQQGDGYTLVVMADTPRVVIGQPAFDREDVSQEIENLQLPHGGANLPMTLAQVESLIRKSSERTAGSAHLTRRRICIFTDLQHTTWEEVKSADCSAVLARLEKLADLEIVDLGQPGENNLAIARLQVDQPLVAAGREVQIQVDIQSHSRDNRLRQPLEILVDGQRVADERVDCPAAGRTTVSVSHRFDAPGEHTIEAHLADDALALDNRRWLSVPVRDSIRVLCIGGRPAETKHLAIALAPQAQSLRSIEVSEAPESRLVESDLAPFDCVAVCNVGRFSLAEAEALLRFVSRGGGLIVFLGDQVQMENYNQLLVDDMATRLLPARLVELAKTATYALDPLEYRHAVVSPFRAFPQSGLLTTPVWKYVRLAPVEGAKTALAFGNGDQAIVEMQVGRGRSIVVATAASPDSVDRSTEEPTPWTALPTWPSFPPLVHEMLRLALAGRGESRNLTVGEDLEGAVPVAASDATVQLTGPAGFSERLPIQSSSPEGRWVYSAAVVSGVYEAHIGPNVQRFAVNVDPRESDLARLESESLPSQFRREPTPAADEPISLAASETGSYFRWLLMAVLALLVIEPCLAWQFGRGRG